MFRVTSVSSILGWDKQINHRGAQLRLGWRPICVQFAHLQNAERYTSSMASLTGTYEKDGERVVGGTVRSDGSVRPIAKVRPGYIAKEDVPKYKPRGARERDARLGIVSAESPIARVETQASGADDNKSAIKARIQAAKAEFERKKREKEKGPRKEEKQMVEESVIFDNSGKSPDDISNMIVAVDNLDIRSTPDTTAPTKTSTTTSKLQSKHKKREDKTERSDSTQIQVESQAESESKSQVESPTNLTTTPQSTQRIPLKSRHARKAESPTEEKSSNNANKTSGYIPPHKRK
jgi:partner of Y14 and mago protein